MHVLSDTLMRCAYREWMHFDRKSKFPGLTLTFLYIKSVSEIPISTLLTVLACCTWLTFKTSSRQAVTAARNGEVKVVIALARLAQSPWFWRLSKIAFCTPRATDRSVQALTSACWYKTMITVLWFLGSTKNSLICILWSISRSFPHLKTNKQQ